MEYIHTHSLSLYISSTSNQQQRPPTLPSSFTFQHSKVAGRPLKFLQLDPGQWKCSKSPASPEPPLPPPPPPQPYWWTKGKKSGWEMSSCSFSPTAYGKTLLHAVKFPDRPIVGLLLGPDGSTVVDAIPLFHNFPTAPITETALAIVQNYCGSPEFGNPSGKVRVVGVYHANERYDDSSLSSFAKILAARFGQETLIFSISNPKLESIGTSRQIAGTLWKSSRSQNWEKMSAGEISGGPGALEEIAESVQSIDGLLDPTLIDFEEFLENPTSSNDWRNLSISFSS